MEAIAGRRHLRWLADFESDWVSEVSRQLEMRRGLVSGYAEFNHRRLSVVTAKANRQFYLHLCSHNATNRNC